MGVAAIALAISMAFVGCDGTGSGSSSDNLATLKIVNETDETLTVRFTYYDEDMNGIVGSVPANSTKSGTTSVKSGYRWATYFDVNNTSGLGPSFDKMVALRPGFTTTITLKGQLSDLTIEIDNPPKP